MKLEVGMYVRTKGGNIFKIIGGNVDNWEIDIDYSKLEQTEENWLELYRYNDNYSFFNDKDIIKVSFNIIDLIEVGDYLNGFKVSKIERYDTNTIIKIGNSTFNVLEGEKIYTPSYDNNNGYEKIEKLKSIVTKEQFESMKYSLEG